MKKSVRYGIVLVGTIFFFAMSPVLIFYTQGKKWNGESLEINQTGILVVAVEPRSAELYLNGKKVSLSSNDSIQSLAPGNYDIEVKKVGYYTWHKNVPIFAGKVTKIPERNEKLQLLPVGTSQDVSGNTSDYTIFNNDLYFLSQKSLNIAPSDEPAHITTVGLDDVYNHVSIIDNSDLLLLSQEDHQVVFNTKTLKLETLPRFDSATHVFAYESSVFTLSNDKLVQYSLDSGTSKQISIKKGVKIDACASGHSFVYCLVSEGQLWSIVDAGNNLKTLVSFDKPLSLGAPTARRDYQLLISNEKEIFIRADNDLYQLKTTLEEVKSNLTNYMYNALTGQIRFHSDTEAYLFDLYSKSSNLVFRSSEKIYSFDLISTLGYGFLSLPNKIIVTELDPKFGVNTHDLVTSSAAEKLIYDGHSNSLYYLEKQVLKRIEFKKP